MSRVLISRQAITVVEIRSQATTVSSNPNTTGSTILFVSAQWSRTPDGRPLTEMTFKASKNVHHHTFKSKSNCNLINSPFLSKIKTCSKRGKTVQEKQLTIFSNSLTQSQSKVQIEANNDGTTILIIIISLAQL